jgi:succinate dehydrogenase / fumarate reductase, iron-sulfur subunit
MRVTLQIQRFDKDKDEKPYFQEFEVEAEPTDRLLDVLMYVKTNIDGSIGLRKSCAHGICGSDAMVINGAERLACKTLVKDVAGDGSAPIRVGPLKSMPVQRDLMVDQYRFFETYREMKPFLINDEPAGARERIQTSEERARIDDATNCILCAACYSSCPVIREKNQKFIGPAAVVNAARFIFDSRDRGFNERLESLDNENGVWPCENHFNCTRVCPRGIKVTKNINLVKKEIKEHKER